MTDLAVIILVGQEKLHIRRCLERLRDLNPRQVFVVESQPSDGTHEIAVEMGATTMFNKWPGLHAKQFNWALDNLPIKASWILRLDADEYLYSDTIEELKGLLPKWDGEKVTDGGMPPDVTSLSLSLSRCFCGRKIRFGGTAHIPMVRFFKYGIGRCQDRAMDEHVVTSKGRDYRLKGEFADDSRIPMDEWRQKHRGYAKREAIDAVAGEKFKTSKTWYYRFPPYLRAFLYFSIRYFLLLGFLDGYAGWMWHFWQALWYRWLVDCEIARRKRHFEISVWDKTRWVASYFWRQGDDKGKAHPGTNNHKSSDKIVVFHVLKTLASEYGGPARSVQGLVASLQGAGAEAHLITIEESPDPWVKGITHYHCLKAVGHKDVYRKICALIDEFKPDIIHTHDCWMPILNMCHRAARDKGVPYMISPRGSLKAWSRRHKWLKKWLALKAYEGYDVIHAAAIHVTANDEYAQVAELGLNKNIIQVSNGLVFPELAVSDQRLAVSGERKKRALFLSRIHYTKGLMNLVDAWAKVKPDDWELEIVGTDADGYQAQVEARVKALGLEDCVKFSGPASDTQKWDKYLGAELFVHPTFTENFGIVIAEALYAGLPVITTKGAPWKALETGKCGWWIDIGVEPLAEALKKAFATPKEELVAMGERGRKLVIDRHSWPALARRMKEEYGKLLANIK